MDREPGGDRALCAVAPEVTPALPPEITLDEAAYRACSVVECLRAGRELR